MSFPQRKFWSFLDSIKSLLLPKIHHNTTSFVLTSNAEKQKRSVNPKAKQRSSEDSKAESETLPLIFRSTSLFACVVALHGVYGDAAGSGYHVGLHPTTSEAHTQIPCCFRSVIAPDSEKEVGLKK
jgi:hypothetical protein